MLARSPHSLGGIGHSGQGVRQSPGTLGLPWNSVLPGWDFQGMEYFYLFPQMEEVVSFYLPLLLQLPFLNWRFSALSEELTSHFSVTFFSFCNFLNFRLFMLVPLLFCHLLFNKTLCLLEGFVVWSEAFPFLKSIIFSSLPRSSDVMHEHRIETVS